MGSSIFNFKQGATYGQMTLAVASGFPSDVSSSTISFAARNAKNQMIVSGASASVTGVATAPDGSKKGTLVFDLSAAPSVTENVGKKFAGEFHLVHTSGKEQIVPSTESLFFNVVETYSLIPVSGPDPGAAGFTQYQTSHGFAVKNLVYWTGSAWAKAKGDSDVTLADAIVILASSPNAFKIAYLEPREVTFTAHGLGAGGTKLYLSQSTAGAITTTAPTSGRSQQIGRVKDANTLMLQTSTVIYL